MYPPDLIEPKVRGNGLIDRSGGVVGRGESNCASGGAGRNGKVSTAPPLRDKRRGTEGMVGSHSDKDASEEEEEEEEVSIGCLVSVVRKEASPA